MQAHAHDLSNYECQLIDSQVHQFLTPKARHRAPLTDVDLWTVVVTGLENSEIRQNL